MNQSIFKVYLIFCFFGIVIPVFAQPNYIFTGGKGDGYATDEAKGVNLMLYKGSNGNGYASDEDEGSNIMLYLGGAGNGFASDEIDGSNFILYEGGAGNGYASISNIHDFIWTGAVGTGWTVAGNWNLNVVPKINSRTIIPNGVPAYPFVNAGVFAIGDNPNNGIYKSGELWIQAGALLVTRVNCKVENYGLITIDGELRVKNKSATGFVSKLGSKVQIAPSGLFYFQ